MNFRIILVLMLAMISFACFADEEEDVFNAVVDVTSDVVYLVTNHEKDLGLFELLELSLMVVYIENVIDNDGDFDLGVLQSFNEGIRIISKAHNLLLPSMFS